MVTKNFGALLKNDGGTTKYGGWCKLEEYATKMAGSYI
jgi:hypothetical protein